MTKDEYSIGSTKVDCRHEIEEIYGAVAALFHLSHFLNSDLEHGLNPKRGGKPVGHNGISLVFQRDGIDATLWMSGEIWLRAKRLFEQVERTLDRIDD